MVLDFIGSVIATSIEGIGLFFLTLYVFRFKPREDMQAIIIANILVSVSNYLMEKYQFFFDYSPLVNIIVMLLVFMFVIRVSFLYSILMTVVGIVAGFIIQGILILTFTVFNSVSLQELRLEDVKYVLQVISGILYFAIGYYLYKNGIGFSKVPFTQTFKIKLSKFSLMVTLTFLFLLSLCTVLISFNNVVLGCSVFMFLAMILTYALYRKEKCND